MPIFGSIFADQSNPSIYDVQKRQDLAKALLSNGGQTGGPLSVLANVLAGGGSAFENSQAAQEAQAGQTQANQALAKVLSGGYQAIQADPSGLASAMGNQFLPQGAANTADDWLKYQQQINTPQYEPGGYNGQPPGYFTAGGANGPTFQTFNPNAAPVGTTGSPTIDPTAQGYDDVVPGAGGLTQRAIDQAAQAEVTTGQRASGGRSGMTIAQATAINNRAAELANGTNIGAQHPQLTALSAALTQAQKNLSQTQTSMGNAEQGFQQLINAFQGKVDLSKYPSVNAAMNAAQLQTDPAAISAFRAGLQEVANEYTQVFARNGRVTDAVRNRAQDVLNGNLSLSDLQQVLTELQAQAKIVIGGYQNQVDDLTTKIKGLGTPGASADSPPSAPSKDDLYQKYGLTP